MVAYPLRTLHVTSPFGIRKDPMNRRRKRMHSGLDLQARYDKVYTMLPGQVTEARYSENGGYYVSIDHGICVCSYLHLSKMMVKKGQRVYAGQLIAISGNSGKRTTGPHLHISCRWSDGKYFDPMLILKFVTRQLSNKKCYGSNNHHTGHTVSRIQKQQEASPQPLFRQIRLGENL